MTYNGTASGFKIKARQKQSGSKDGGGRICIVHFAGTVDESITPLTQKSLCKLKKTAAKRLKFDDDEQKLSHLSNNIPDEIDATV